MLFLLLGLVCSVAWAQTAANGQEVTITNIQKDGTEWVLFIDDNGVLKTRLSTAESKGDAEKFVATRQDNGKYTFFNETKGLYLIWRSSDSQNYGYNSNKGTLSTYDENYCQWTLNNSSSTIAGTYYMVSKRSDSSDGSLIVMKESGNFDAWGNSLANNANYTNMFKIQGQLSYNLTDKAENTYSGTYQGLYGMDAPTFTGINGYEFQNPIWNGTTYSAVISFPFPVSKVDGATNSVMISSFKNGYGSNCEYGYKWYASDTEVKVTKQTTRTPISNTDINSYLWAIYPKFEANTFSFAIKNIATDKYIYTEADYATGVGSHNKGTVYLSETQKYFCINNTGEFYYTGSSNQINQYLSLNSNGTADQYLGVIAKTHNGTTNTFMPASKLSIKTMVGEKNANTHLGSICAVSDKYNVALKADASNESVQYLYCDNTNGVSIELTRKYRGYEFLGFWLGETELGLTPTLTAEQVNTVNEANPIIAKYKPTDEVTLFYDDDEFSYRIPAIAKTSTGRLIAVSDYRHCLDDIGMNRWGKGYRIDLVIRTSDDNGKTWSAIKTIAEGKDNSQDNDCAYGDAAIAVVGEEVIVMAVAGATQYNTGNADKVSRLVRVYSANNGEDWEKTDITEKVYGHEGALYPDVYTAFFGSGKLAVDPNFNNTGNARIYGAMLTQGKGNQVIYSDDKGLTWQKLGTAEQVAGANEPKVEILPSGQILFSARRSGGRNFNVFTYTDKNSNTGTWGSAVNGCSNGGSNGTNGDILCIEAKKADGNVVKLLLQSQPKGGTSEWDRNDVTIWYKEISDSEYNPSTIAANWTEGLQVSHQLSAYSAMSEQNDGKIAFFFEEAPCYQDRNDWGYSMVYVPLGIEEITGGNYFQKDADLSATRNFNVVLTDAQGNEYVETIEDAPLSGIASAIENKYPFITLGNEANFTAVDENTYNYTNTVTLPFKVSNENGTYWHNMYWPTAAGNAPVYMGANTSGETYVRTFAYSNQQYGNSPLNTQANEGKISWALYSVDNRLSFVFKNKETGKYIKVTGVHNGNAQNVEFTEKADATCFGIEPDQGSYHGDYALKTQNTDFGGYLCATASTYGYATNFLRSTGVGTDHQGAWVIFKEAPDFDALITEVNDVLSWIGEGLGKYAVSESNTAIAETAKTAMQTPNTVKLNDLNTYKNLLDGATLNLPETGQFMRIKGISGNYIDASSIHGDAQATTGQMSMKSAENCNYAGTIFYLDEEKHLLNYAKATFIKETSHIGSIGDAQKGVWTFAESPRTGKAKYALSCTTTNNNGRNLHDNSGNRADRCSGNCGDRHDFTLEPVTSLPFTFKAAALGYATFNAPVAVEMPEGVIAYVAQIVGESTLKMRKFISENGGPVVVPANTPVMLYKENVSADTQISLDIVEDTYSDEEVAEISAKNSFVGTVAAETYPEGATVYSLQKKQKEQDSDPDMVGFFKKASDTTLAGFKAWVKTATASARSFTIIFDGDNATGIKEALGLENENVEIYDLSGRRLDKPAKGVNVIGGKLVVK